MLKSNAGSLNDECSKLYEVLIDVHLFLCGVIPNVLLRKLHFLHPTFQDILGHSIPIICSCYLDHREVDVSAELNSVLDKIKHIKSEAREVKLYYFPRVDDLGFMEFFSRYLEDLMKNQEISIIKEIGALHFEVESLLSLAKVTYQQLEESPWTDIVNMSYQAEYIIDLYLVSSSKHLELVSSLSKMIEKLKNIRVDVDSLCSKSHPSQDVVVRLTSQPQVFGTTTKVTDNDTIMSFQEEATIIEYLLMGENKLDIISIIGMAGVGKTTLALTLFHDPLVADHFDKLAWCTVSQSYENRDLVLLILDQVNGSDRRHRSISDNEELFEHLCKRLRKLRYLIILDDIWHITLWNDLKRYLPDDRKGSRILITTRDKGIADQMGSKVNELHGLSKEKSWKLFEKKMLGKESISNDLLEISKGVVGLCKGLPLSIVIIAGVLSDTERTTRKWNQIAESLSSIVLSDPQGKCKGILELSYNHLPNHLRSCFLYLGSFPEDQEISVNRLILLWIAEGLVQDINSDSAEEVANKYMKNLIAKNLVIPAKKKSLGGVQTFRLHDLLRDFCLDKAKEMHFFTLLSDNRKDSQPLQDPRRLIIKEAFMIGLNFSCHSFRSMICYSGLGSNAIEKGICLRDMLLLKVLDVGYVLLFQSVSSLVHLRYLALGLGRLNFTISLTPISKLQNLEILILKREFVVIKVADFIWDMVKLRHVNISMEASFQVDSNRVEKSSFLLENLRSLSNARVSCGDSKWLRKLSRLQRLRCTFVDDDPTMKSDSEEEDNHIDPTIKGDSEEEEGQYYLEENGDLKGDDGLEENGDLEDEQSRKLNFNDHLTSLKVRNGTGPKKRSISPCPRFLDKCQLPISLRELTLSNFLLKPGDISEIGRAVRGLEVFKIYGCSVPSEYKWNVDDDDFPELKVLKLSYLKICNWITSEYSFPKLEQLCMEECDYLDEIPTEFGYLQKLQLISVRECTSSVDDSAREIEKLQHEEQNIEMRVTIYPKSRRLYYFNRSAMDTLLRKLVDGNPEEQRAAAEDLSFLVGLHDNIVCMTDAGAIPLLVELLSFPYSITQEHVIATLLKLSITKSNKETIVKANAIPYIVELLKNGSTEARDNAAETLFSLAVDDENLVAICAAGAMPPLIDLLHQGSPRGNLDASMSVYNPFYYQDNKVRAVRAGIVPPLIRLINDYDSEMMDQALAILAILAGHSEGKQAIIQSEPIPMLIDLMRTTSPANRENAASVLWSLCTWDSQLLDITREHGAEEVLKQLSNSGTDTAASLFQLLRRIEVDNLSNHALTI